MKKILARILICVMVLGLVQTGNTAGTAKAASTDADIYYAVHCQTYGWGLGVAKNGEVTGTSGQAKRLESIKIWVKSELSGSVEYETHVQTYGWSIGTKKDSEECGTTGEAKRLEAIKIRLTGQLAEVYDVVYRVHRQTYGWTDWVKNGTECGTTGQAKRLEAIQIKLVRKNGADDADLKYTTHVQTHGWLDYVVDGKQSGTTGEGKRLEAIKIDVPNTSCTGGITYSVHCQTYGWMDWVTNDMQAGTSGQAKRLEAIKIDLKTQGVTGGIVYNTHVQSLGWTKDVSNNGVSGTTGQSKRIEAICMHLTGDITAYYDIYYRVHCQSLGWLDWAKNGQMAGTTNGGKRMEAIQIQLVKKGGKAPGATAKPYVYIEPPAITKDTYEIRVNKQESCITIYKDGVPIKAMACSPGDATPVGTFYLAGKWRWNALMGGVQGQYCSQIQGDFLFHSVLYNKTNPRTLIPSSYNNLGKRVSHGCVRLQVIDAKWIFDNCPRGTKITIYNSSDPGPLGKPVLQKIPGSQTWDPTDPAI